MKTKAHITALAALIVALMLTGCAGPAIRHEVRTDRRDDRRDYRYDRREDRHDRVDTRYGY